MSPRMAYFICVETKWEKTWAGASTNSLRRVSLRMFRVPFPGTLDDVAQLRILRMPAEFLCGFGGRRDEFGRVARPTRLFDSGDGMVRDGPRHFDHLADTVAVAVAQVIAVALRRTGAEFLQRQDVGLGEIDDVN